jgi:DNA-binding response OmpR family regulator
MQEIVILSESGRLRDVMRAALAGDGYHISEFSPMACELAALAALGPDLLILDWYPGVEDHGLQLLQSLKLYPPLADLPIIVCSAPTSIVRGLRLQMRQVQVQLLCKPFAIGELHAAVEAALPARAPALLEQRLTALSPMPQLLRGIDASPADIAPLRIASLDEALDGAKSQGAPAEPLLWHTHSEDGVAAP